MAEISLAPATAEDYDAYYAIRCSPADIYWNGHTGKPDKNAFYKAYVNRINTAPFNSPDDSRIFLVALNNRPDLFIGFVLFTIRQDGIELGYTIVEDYQRLGYGTKALRKGVEIAAGYKNTIYVRVRDDNIASIKTAERSGFRATNEYELRDYPGAGEIKFRKYVFSKVLRIKQGNIS